MIVIGDVLDTDGRFGVEIDIFGNDGVGRWQVVLESGAGLDFLGLLLLRGVAIGHLLY